MSAVASTGTSILLAVQVSVITQVQSAIKVVIVSTLIIMLALGLVSRRLLQPMRVPAFLGVIVFFLRERRGKLTTECPIHA